MKFDNKEAMIMIGLSFICILVIAIGMIFNNDNKGDIAKFKKEYEESNGQKNGDKKYIDVNISLNRSINYLDEKDLIKTMDTETAIFYFGFPTCPWCRNIVDPLLEVAKDKKVKVYYFNPQNIRGENNDTYKKLINKLKKYLMMNPDGKETLYVPDVYFIKNGKIVGNHLGSVESQEDPYVKINVQQQNELKSIYNKKIQKMK